MDSMSDDGKEDGGRIMDRDTFKELTQCHKKIDVNKVDKLLDLIADKSKDIITSQMLTFVLESYELTQYGPLLEAKDNEEDVKLGEDEDVTEFYEWLDEYGLDDNDNFESERMDEYDIYEFCCDLYKQYCTFRGTKELESDLNISPQYKIKDNMAIFMSYTFGMNLAIKQYIKPSPPISPIIIDFWIIPNRTVNINDDHKEIDQDIGNINIRLRQNKTTYITKRVKPNNIKIFCKQVCDCLSDKKIRDKMNEMELNRVIFIIDRRYNNGKDDKLFCILPPPEYGQVAKSSFDILNISHWYCTSNYLLPRTSRLDNDMNIDNDHHIGSSSSLNGYMFLLSYLIFPNPHQIDLANDDNDNKQDNTISLAMDDNQEEIDKYTESKTEQVDDENDDPTITQRQPSLLHRETIEIDNVNNNGDISKKPNMIKSRPSNNILIIDANIDDNEEEEMANGGLQQEQEKEQQQQQQHEEEEEEEKKYSEDELDVDVEEKLGLKVEYHEDNLDIQWSTSNVKILFSTQNMTLRFSPEHMIKLWPKYFLRNEKQVILNDPDIKIKDFVAKLFELNLYDPYFLHFLDEVEELKEKIQFKYYIPSNKLKYDMNEGLTKILKWQKVHCQSRLDSVQSTANLQLKLLNNVIPDENIEYKFEEIQSVLQSEPILVESEGYCRPVLDFKNIDYHSIYDCICWDKQGDIRPNIRDYMRYQVRLQDILSEEKQSETAVNRLIKYDDIYHGSRFLYKNESLLIDDGIVPYAYYLCIVSHIIKHLMLTNIDDSFQFTVSIISKSVRSTNENKIKRLSLPKKFNDLGEGIKIKDKDKGGLIKHIQKVAKYIKTFYHGNLRNTRINLIIDRRGSKSNSIDCNIYTYYSQWDMNERINAGYPHFESSIINMNTNSSTIPNLDKDTQSHPQLFHFNFYRKNQSQDIIGYMIRNGSCIRFYPESTMNIWPKIFYGDPHFLQDIVFKNKFRHSFNVGLSDNVFTRNYYALFNKKFISINYYRPKIGKKAYRRKSSSLTGMEMPLPFIRQKTSVFVAILKKGSCTDDLMLNDNNNINNNNSIHKNILQCAVIQRIIFLLQRHMNELQGIDELIDICNGSEYTVTNLMDDIHHLNSIHQFATNKEIKQEILNKAQINDCQNDDCEAMQRHCRKSMSMMNINKETAAEKKYRNKNEIAKTWISQLDKIHCTLFHANKTTRFRYGRMKSVRNKGLDPFSQILPEQEQGILNEEEEEEEEEEKINYENGFSMLKFGISIDEWFSPYSLDKPEFDNLEQEVLQNRYEPIEKEMLNQIKFEVQSRYFSLTSNQQNLSVNELLSLKLFTDCDTLQKEFSKAFWDDDNENLDVINRRKQFYHWATMLRRAFKYANIPIRRKLYRGYDRVLQLPSFNPFCGQPTSTSIDMNVAKQFADGKGIIISSSNKASKLVYGMDVSWFSRFQNEKEVWIYDQNFPIQKAMVVLNNQKIKINFIQTHLKQIGHELDDVTQFLNDPKEIHSFISQIENNPNLLKNTTKYRGLNVFERLFFEWKRYLIRAPPLDKFKNIIGDVELIVKDGYVYIKGVKTHIVDTFYPTTFIVEYSYGSKYWNKYDVNVSRLDGDSPQLIPFKSADIKYKFVTEYNNNDDESDNEIKRILKSEIKKIKLIEKQIEKIAYTVEKSKLERKHDNDETDDSDTEIRPSTSLIDQIDRALARYYKQHERDDYFNEDGVGMFKAYCDDNGFDDDVVEAEMDTEPDECMLIELDDDFPFKKHQRDREKAIFKVIKRCYEDPEAYTHDLTYEMLDVSIYDFNINLHSREMTDIKDIMREQCYHIFRKGFQEDRMMTKLLCVDKRLHQPYLQLLADMYGRDRIKAQRLKIEDWANDNKHMLKVKKLSHDKLPWISIQEAIKQWYHIICPILMLNSQTKIEDSLEKCCQYITHAVDFVYNYAKKYEDLLPFHFDFVIGVPNVLMVGQAIKKYQPQERDTDSDTDDSDSDSDYRRDEYDFVDCIGDLYSKLKANNCIYAGSVIQPAPYQIDNFKITSNVQLNKRFEIWKQTKLSKKYKGDEFNDYPRRKRFICMIDRRNRDKSGNDKCVFWETLSDSNSWPEHPDDKYINLTYYDRSSTCLIPKIGYNPDTHNVGITHEEAAMTTKQKLLSQTITTNTHCKGGVMTLSFHVEAVKEIRCYFFLNGQMMRFIPEDLKRLLPQFFVPSDANRQFAKSALIEQMIKYIKPRLRDQRFEAFYKENGSPLPYD